MVPAATIPGPSKDVQFTTRGLVHQALPGRFLSVEPSVVEVNSLH